MLHALMHTLLTDRTGDQTAHNAVTCFPHRSQEGHSPTHKGIARDVHAAKRLTASKDPTPGSNTQCAKCSNSVHHAHTSTTRLSTLLSGCECGDQGDTSMKSSHQPLDASRVWRARVSSRSDTLWDCKGKCLRSFGVLDARWTGKVQQHANAARIGERTCSGAMSSGVRTKLCGTNAPHSE